MKTFKNCNHTYGWDEKKGLLDLDNYHPCNAGRFIAFTYCPWCRLQLHTIDGILLGAQPLEGECMMGGCED